MRPCRDRASPLVRSCLIRAWERCFGTTSRLLLATAEAAIETLRRDETYRTSSRRFLAASLAQLGRLEEARAEVELFLVGSPNFTTSHWATTEPFRDAATLEHFVDGYRKAGLPE